MLVLLWLFPASQGNRQILLQSKCSPKCWFIIFKITIERDNDNRDHFREPLRQKKKYEEGKDYDLLWEKNHVEYQVCAILILSHSTLFIPDTKNDEECILKTRDKRNIFLCKFYLLSKHLKSLAKSDFFFFNLFFCSLYFMRLLASSKPHPVLHALSRHLCTWQAQHLQWCLTTPNQGAITHST